MGGGQVCMWAAGQVEVWGHEGYGRSFGPCARRAACEEFVHCLGWLAVSWQSSFLVGRWHLEYRYSAYHHSHPTLTERLRGLESFQAEKAKKKSWRGRFWYMYRFAWMYGCLDFDTLICNNPRSTWPTTFSLWNWAFLSIISPGLQISWYVHIIRIFRLILCGSIMACLQVVH